MSAHIIPFPGVGAIPVEALPMDALLSAIPSLPRPVLARLTARMIDRMDEIDGDPDLELEEDRCVAGDDGCAPVFAHGRRLWGADDEGEC